VLIRFDNVPPAGISRVAWNQPIEAIAPSVRQYPRTPAPRSTATTELAAKSVNESPPNQVTEMTKTSKLFIAAFLLAPLICVCIIVFKGGFEPQESSSSSGNTQENSKHLSSNSEIKQSNSQKDAAEWFSKKEVHRVDLHLDTNKWKYLNENALDEEYVEANVSINGEDVGKIGLRYKGDSTLRQCVDGSGEI